jgi:hypothetical protein
VTHRVAGAVLLALAGLACLTPAERRKDALMREARMFNDDLRWGRFAQLSSLMPPREAQLFMARVGVVGEDLVIADFEVTAITFARDTDKATVEVKVSWYTKARAILRDTTLTQKWENRAGQWLCVKQSRLRGVPFPLLPDPADESAVDVKQGAQGKPDAGR